MDVLVTPGDGYNGSLTDRYCPVSVHVKLRTDEIIGLSHVVVPDGDIQGLLGQLTVFYFIAELL